MRDFNLGRLATTTDEIWFLEHPAVFTRGVSCKLSPRKNPQAIPIVDSDRGGQITYHGPGQQIVYLLFDLKRAKQGVRHLVRGIEQAVIDTLAQLNVTADRVDGAPGIYVDGRKIAALGLRIRNGFSYHGLSFNLDMDLGPFSLIDPCGYQNLEVVNLDQLCDEWSREQVADELGRRLACLVNSNKIR